MQTWLGSIVEMKANLAIGFALNWCINIAVLPILWNPASPKLSAFYIGLVFTVVSCCRQLFIRRRMNKSKRFNAPEGGCMGDSGGIGGPLIHPCERCNRTLVLDEFCGCNIPVESLGRNA